MLLDKEAFQQFSERERNQAEHLRKGLLGRHQDIYEHPRLEVRRLSYGRRLEMTAPNPYARIRWMRTLGGYFCEAVGATAPDYMPQVPVYHFTVLDKRQCVSVCKPPDLDLDEYEEERWARLQEGRRPPPRPTPEPLIWQVREAYEEIIGPLQDCVGMIEPALYVYSAQELGWPYVAHYHAHVLAWGESERRMKRVAQEIGHPTQSILPYGRGVVFRRVCDHDLLQMIWYVTKSPRKQHQLLRREHSLKQFKGAINGVNSVRLYSSMRDIELPDLAVASGRGRRILRQTEEGMSRWIQRSQ
jgi:hypothetical protein